MARPLIALLGLPDLVEPVRDAGHTLLTDSTETEAVRQAVIDLRAVQPAQPIIVIAAHPNMKTHGWLVSLSNPTHVLMLHSETLPLTNVPNAKKVELPATIDDIFAVFGAPGGRGPGGVVLVRADGRTKDAEEIDSSFMAWDDDPEPAPVVQESSRVPDFGSDDFDTDVPISAPEPAPVVAPAETVDDDDDDLAEFITKPSGPVAEPSGQSQSAPSIPVFEPAPAAPVVQPEPRVVERQPVTIPAPAPEAIEPEPEPYRPPAPAAHDLDELFATRRDAPVIHDDPNPRYQKLAPVIFVIGARGGLGKSTSTMSLAERAARGGIPRVVAVDGSPGQSDIVKYLRLNTAKLPTIYDAAVTGDPAKALVTPDMMYRVRGELLPRLSFAAVLGPTSTQADPNVITPAVYANMLRHLRSTASLVIVDTQIQEAYDAAGFFEQVWLPLLASEDTWGVYLMDTSRPGIMNAIERLTSIQEYGVPPGRMVAFINKAVTGSAIDPQAFQTRLAGLAEFVGVTPDNPTIHNSTQAGIVPQAVPEYAIILDRILHKVTGLPAFDPDRPDGPAAVKTDKPRKGLFGRMGRR